MACVSFTAHDLGVQGAKGSCELALRASTCRIPAELGASGCKEVAHDQDCRSRESSLFSYDLDCERTLTTVIYQRHEPWRKDVDLVRSQFA